MLISLTIPQQNTEQNNPIQVKWAQWNCYFGQMVFKLSDEAAHKMKKHKNTGWHLGWWTHYSQKTCDGVLFAAAHTNKANVCEQ